MKKIVEFIKKIFCPEPVKVEKKHNQWLEAVEAMNIARNHFDNCEADYISTAIFELNAAESRMDAARRVFV